MGENNEFRPLQFEIRFIILKLEQATAKGQAHLQFAQSITQSKNCKRACPLATRIDTSYQLETTDNKTNKK
jgi:hypothetical protein